MLRRAFREQHYSHAQSFCAMEQQFCWKGCLQFGGVFEFSSQNAHKNPVIEIANISVNISTTGPWWCIVFQIVREACAN
jgi:hypothetical protein